MSEEDPNKHLQDRIRDLIPINELTPNLQSQLFQRAKILEIKKSKFIFQQGDKDNFSYYLLEGEIELYSNNELNSVIKSDSDRARYALAQLQPRQFSAKAKSSLKIFQVDRNTMDQLMVLAQEHANNDTFSGGGDIEVDEVDGVEDGGDWMTMMLQSELFSRMPMANIHQLFALLEPVEFNAGDVVVEQGSVGENYYIISEGRCAVSRKPTPTSDYVKLAELHVGDSFGEEALIANTKRNATVTMITDGVLMQLAKDTFVELIKKPTLKALKFAEAKAKVDEGKAIWLDVRFPNEHQESSIAGSINIPLNSLRLKNDQLNESSVYILYCDTGGRSSTGAFLLAERGYEVAYLDGGLVNNPDAAASGSTAKEPEVSETKTAAPSKPIEPVKLQAAPVKKPEPEPEVEDDDDELDEDLKVEMLNAKLETTQIRMQRAAALREEEDEQKRKAHEENQRKLMEERQRLEEEKRKAEEAVKKRAQDEELRLQKMKEDAEKKMQAEQKKLEEIYNKNAMEMAKLQKMREEAEEKVRQQRAMLEQQAEEKVKAEREKLEREAEEAQKKLQERERQLQAEAKAKIEAEKRKLAEQYERNSQEFESLQRQKAAAEAARVAARKEAEEIIREYKESHDKSRIEAEEKIKAERLKLEEESRKIQETMKQIQQAKIEAERIKEEALAEARRLKEKQMDSTSSKVERDKLEVEIKAVEEKVYEAERELEDAIHKEKITVVAQEENSADLERKRKEQEVLMAQINNDLSDFAEQQKEDAPTNTQIQMQADLMKRIKAKAAEAKKKAADANADLLSDVANQLQNK